MKRTLIAVSLVMLTAFSVTSAQALNLVTNGGFETGDFSGWSTSGSYINVLSNYPDSGNYYASLGTEGSLGSLLQAQIPTIDGQVYELTYSLARINSGATPNEFIVSVNGVTMADEVNAGTQPYTPYSYLFTADNSQTEISFFERNDGGAFALDNVSVDLAPVPEPCTLLLLGSGLVGAGFLRRKQKA